MVWVASIAKNNCRKRHAGAPLINLLIETNYGQKVPKGMLYPSGRLLLLFRFGKCQFASNAGILNCDVVVLRYWPLTQHEQQ